MTRHTEHDSPPADLGLAPGAPPISAEPAILALARLLGRQAAREWVARHSDDKEDCDGKNI